MQTSSTWSPMVSGPEDEFSNFLEFGDLQLNFPPFDVSQQNGGEIQDGGGPASAMDMQTSNTAGGIIDFHHGNLQPFPDSAALTDFDTSSAVFPDLSMTSHLFEQQQMPQAIPYGHPYRSQNMIPHTPSSIEMHGGQPHYQHPASSNHARAVFEHYRHQSRGQLTMEQTTFTPLVSPAVTPHDAHFRYPEYAVPGEYFSPLTSPALEAQNNANQRSVYSALRGSDTSDTTSPVDMNIDPSLQSSAVGSARKPRRKAASTAPRGPSRSVRQSPAMKPQARKKQSSSTSIPSERVAGIFEDAENAKRSLNATQQAGGKLPMGISQESSEAESISPEPLSEILMPPPATPKSASLTQSPQFAAKPGSQSAPMPPTTDKPATPASLMKIRKGTSRPAGSALKERTSLLESELEQTMDAMVLPESARGSAKRPALTPLRTSDANDDELTPTMSARKTPRIAATSAPVTATGSAFPSPASPNTAQLNKRGDSRISGRGGKKRTNSSSVQVSPALRPRISPSIKPLLPEGAVVSAETSALLLASKSNYQNLLEGTHLPGVSYPETLSTNLTSKRTSHKIAEQGRRNRINTALQEIASLLPATPNGATPKDANFAVNGNGKMANPGASVMMTGTAAQQANSKASTVESAIDYIKALQGELRDVKAKLEATEQKLANGSAGPSGTADDKDGAKGSTAAENGNGKDGDDDG
ncbi:MAG: hypothetical protein LQ346_001539 [Caloplaca aetnensis]|nr:MAG: hypothetical protein LQ346_001539 [Caloplaca aetnensis]